MESLLVSKLESAGYQIIVTAENDPHSKTRTFIVKPDGTQSEYFDYLWQIPMNLREGDEVCCPDVAVPVQARNTESHELHAQNYNYDARGNLIAGIILGLIFIGIVVGILFMKAFFSDNAHPPPCGIRGSIIDIDECFKEIIYPDCSGVMYDSCENKIVDRFDPIVQNDDWYKWIVYGAVAVGGVFIGLQLLKMYKSHRPRERNNYRGYE